MSGYDSWGYYEESWDSECDSTWEDDEDYKNRKESKPKIKYSQYSRSSRAAKDLQRYRHGYPEPMLNLKFYRNEIPFEPNGVYIDDLHNYWKCNYDELEWNHSYIQWLFPLQEPGVNRSAIPLTKKEIKEMKNDEDVMMRLLKSYKLMLGFYGIQLIDSETGEVTRADNWRERFSNLNTNTHNNLRITRILKCLGEFGYKRYQAPLVRFFLEETLCHGNLPNVKTSVLNYFMFTVKKKSVRKELVLYAWENYEPKDRFIWGPVQTLRKLRPPAPSPEEKSDYGSEDEPAEDENIHRFQKIAWSKDDQSKARENQQESRGHIASSPANGEQTKKHIGTGKTESTSHLSEHSSVENENTSQMLQKEKDMENGGSGNMLVLKNDKDNEESPEEPGSGGNKEIEIALPVSREVEENKELEDLEDYKTKDASSPESRIEDDKDNRGLPNAGPNKGVENGQQPMQVEQGEGGPPTNSGSEEKKKKGEYPMQSGSAHDKDNKGPTAECDVEKNSKKEGENGKQTGKSRSEGGLSITTTTEEKEKGGHPMQSGSVGDKDNTGQTTECDLENREKEGPQIELKSADEEKHGEQSMQPRSEYGQDNTGQTTECDLENSEKEGPQIELKSADEEKHGEQSMQPKSADGQDNKVQQTECKLRNKKKGGLGQKEKRKRK